MIIWMHSSMVSGQCGIGIIKSITDMTSDPRDVKTLRSGFFAPDYSVVDSSIPKDRINRIHHKGGCAFFGTGFINTPVMKELYSWLCANYKMVSITPVRRNRNSDNNFFYAMFDDKENNDVAYIESPKWPFGE